MKLLVQLLEFRYSVLNLQIVVRLQIVSSLYIKKVVASMLPGYNCTESKCINELSTKVMN